MDIKVTITGLGVGLVGILILKLWQLFFGSCAEGCCRELDLYPSDLTSIFILSHYLALTVAEILGKTLTLFSLFLPLLLRVLDIKNKVLVEANL